RILILTTAIALAISVSAQVGAIDLNRPGQENPPPQSYDVAGPPSVAAATHGAAGEHEKKQKYTCPMHPEVVMDHPGNCPKCCMAQSSRVTRMSARGAATIGSMLPTG